MMIVGLLIVFLVLPVGIMNGPKLTKKLTSGPGAIGNHPNFNGGYPVAEFEDPAGDLLRPAPQGESGNALDIRKFEIRKIKFSPLAGAGIEPRLNLVFGFDCQLPNPGRSGAGPGPPVIHVYIDVPLDIGGDVTSDKLADPFFKAAEWDFQVIVGAGGPPRIFNRQGGQVGEGLGLYFGHDIEYAAAGPGRFQPTVKATNITAALPIEIVGDPSRGEWTYYVVVGHADPEQPSMMWQGAAEEFPRVFDAVGPVTGGAASPEFSPLKVSN